jgi:HEPN domain-containing protein
VKQQEWERYLKQAKHTLNSAKRDCIAEDFDWACFKAHQAGELILKGWLRSTDRFVTGHSLLKLLEKLKPQTEIPETLHKCARELDKVYIPSRYPDVYSEGSPLDFYDRTNAEESIGCVEQILAFIENLAHNAQ